MPVARKEIQAFRRAAERGRKAGINRWFSGGRGRIWSLMPSTSTTATADSTFAKARAAPGAETAQALGVLDQSCG
jgi:hypothetical protein